MTLTIRDMFDMADEPVTGDAFAQYGEEQAPAGRGHPSNRYARKHEADLSPLEKKLREKQRLSAHARASRTVRRKAAFEQEPRLRDFARYLRTIPKCGDDLPAVLRASWLPSSPLHVRLAALELVTRRCDQINRSMGFDPLDDLLPPERNTWMRCHDVLYPGGRS